MTFWVWRNTDEELENEISLTNEGVYQLTMNDGASKPEWQGDPLISNEFFRIDWASLGSGGYPVSSCTGNYSPPWGPITFAELYSRDGTIDLKWGNVDNWEWLPNDEPSFRTYDTWGYYWTGEHETTNSAWPGYDNNGNLGGYNWGEMCNDCNPNEYPDCKSHYRSTWPSWYTGSKIPRLMTNEECTKEDIQLLQVQWVKDLVDLKTRYWLMLVYPESVLAPTSEW